MRAWQVDAENRACTQGTVYVNAAAALLHDPINGREAKARTFPLLFSRKEGLEDVPQRLGVHAAAGIANRQQDMGTGPNTRVLTAVELVKFPVGGLDHDLTAQWHRISGVDHQVDQNLLDHDREDRKSTRLNSSHT